jgi:hypothetical protein
MLKFGWLLITFSFFWFLFQDTLEMEAVSYGCCVIAIIMGRMAASKALKEVDTDGDGEISEEELENADGGKLLHGAAGAMLANAAMAQMGFLTLWIGVRWVLA